MREHVQDEIDRSRKQQTSEAFTGVLSDLINKSYSGAIGSAYQARARREEGYQRALRDRELKYEDQTGLLQQKTQHDAYKDALKHARKGKEYASKGVLSKGGKDVPGYYTKAGDWVETRGYDPRPQRALGKDPLTGYQQIINKMTGERKTLGAPGLNPNQRKRIDAHSKLYQGTQFQNMREAYSGVLRVFKGMQDPVMRDNPQFIEGSKTFLARAMGEKGPLNEGDIRRLAGNQSTFRSLMRTFKKAKDGTLTDADRQDVINLSRYIMKGIEEKFGAAKKNIHGAAAINPANKRILKELQGITDASSLTEDDEKIKEMEKHDSVIPKEHTPEEKGMFQSVLDKLKGRPKKSDVRKAKVGQEMTVNIDGRDVVMVKVEDGWQEKD